MNILFITNELNYTCGVTTHLLNLVQELSKLRDINVSIICGGGSGIDRFDEIGLSPIVKKTFLHSNRSYLNYARALSNLKRYIRTNKIDMIHSHSHYAANLAFQAAKGTGIITIQTNHGILETKGRLQHFKADKIIAINEHIYDHIEREKIAGKEKVELIRCGVHILPTPPWKAKIKLRIITASRFVYEKGLDIFINAVNLLPSNDRDKAEFLIAGEGELEEELKKLNRETGSNIKFLGRVKDMPSLLRDTHIFVFTSRSGSEGFPAVITEAAAYNNLVISSDCGGIDSVLNSDVDGLIFKADDPYDLMIKLKLSIDGYDTFKPMAEHFYFKVKELYNLDTMIKKHIELYNSCLSSR
jgi:glycosyltransferase involved in cell wall biosynthesis